MPSPSNSLQKAANRGKKSWFSRSFQKQSSVGVFFGGDRIIEKFYFLNCNVSVIFDLLPLPHPTPQKNTSHFFLAENKILKIR